MSNQTKFLPGDPWPSITASLSKAGRGPAECAIAYVGTAGPHHLPLRDDDLLVCNASDDALRGHATSPTALLGYVDSGVDVYNHQQLHAKVIVCDDVAWVGSANASRNSAVNLQEAVLRTTEPSAVRAARAFVRQLAGDSTPLSRPTLEAMLARVPQTRLPVRFPPTGPRIVPPPLGLPSARDTVHFVETQYAAPTPDEEEEERRQIERIRHRKARARVKARLSSAWWSGRRVPRGEWVCWVSEGAIHRPWQVAEYTKYERQTWMWGYEPFKAWPTITEAQLAGILQKQTPAITYVDRLSIKGQAVEELASRFLRVPPRRLD